MQAYINTIEVTAKSKIKKLKSKTTAYLLSSLFAGIFIGFGVGLASVIGNSLLATNNPFVVILPSAVFSVALIMIVALKLELFTSNAMYMAYLKDEKNTVGKIISLLAICWLGNLVGSLIFSYSMHLTHLFNNNEYLLKLATKKANTEIFTLFVKGIYCNILVCAGVFMAITTKYNSAKILYLIVAVTTFFSLGFEHSIANMSLIHAAMLLPNSGISYYDYFHNLIPVTIGNIIGGTIFMGYTIIYINKE